MTKSQRIDTLLADFSRQFGLRRDSTDSRFEAVASADPVEIDVAGYLYALARLMKPHTVVETGTNTGVSTLSIAKALADDGLPGARIITYDIDDHGVQQAASQHNLGHLVSFRQHSSLESSLQAEVAKIDLLFLDSLPSLLADELEHFLPLLQRHSIIVVHDSRLFGEKTAAIEAFKTRYGWESVATHVGRGVTLISSGANGYIAPSPQPITYTLVADARTAARPDTPLDAWPLETAPQQVVWVGTQPQAATGIFDGVEHTTAADLPAGFATASQTNADYLLYLDVGSGDPAPSLHAAWSCLHQHEPPVYATAAATPEIPWNKGAYELGWLLPRWKLSPEATITVQMPHLSRSLFFVNRLFWTQIAITPPGTSDRDWYFSTMACRMLLADGRFEPVSAVAAPPGAPKRVNDLAGPQSVEQIVQFYQHMPPPIRAEIRQNWRRILRIYYFGNGHEPLTWRSVVRQPNSIKSIVHCMVKGTP